MADKRIVDFSTLTTAEGDDLLLIASLDETYNMKVATLREAMGEAASKPPIVRNGYWYTWDERYEQYVNTGTPAQGEAAGFGTVSATIDSNVGTPSITVTASGPATAKNFAFAFHNMKGETGDVTPAAQTAQAAAEAAQAAAETAQAGAENYAEDASDYADAAEAQADRAEQAAEEAEQALSTKLDKANVYNGLDKTVEGYALDARQGKALNDAKFDKENVYNNVDQTATGYALDARQGKTLNDKINATQSDIAIIIEGNQTAHTGGVAVGEYVTVRNSTIFGITDGLYKATQAIPANTAIDSTYLTAVDGGGLNELNSKITDIRETSVFTHIILRRVGNVVSMFISDGTYNTNSSANIIDGSSNEVKVPSGYKPIWITTFLEAFNAKRLTVQTNGTIQINGQASKTGVILRASATWITSDAMPS